MITGRQQRREKLLKENMEFIHRLSARIERLQQVGGPTDELVDRLNHFMKDYIRLRLTDLQKVRCA